MTPQKISQRVIVDRLDWVQRMVHFYHEISAEELYEICVSQLSDLNRIAQAYGNWLKHHPELLDDNL